jgi:hypothetical protein
MEETLEYIRNNQHLFPDLSEKTNKITKDQLKYIRCQGFKTALEYVQFIYYLRYIKNYDIGQMKEAWGNSLRKKQISTRGMQNKLYDIGMSYSLEEAQKKANRKRDFKAIRHKGLETSIKNALSYGGYSASAVEAAIRSLISTRLQSHKDVMLKEWEIITGMVDRSIMAPYEIDIPVMCYNTMTGKVVRIAIEVNGDYWHKMTEVHDADEIKAKNLMNKGWKLIEVNIESNYSKKGYIDKCVEMAVNQVLETLNTNKTLQKKAFAHSIRP